MIIKKSNGHIINTDRIYIHDDILLNLQFERSKNEIQLVIEESASKGHLYSIGFFDVLGFQMTSCDFWGHSPHILDFEYVEPENNTIIPELLKKNLHPKSCSRLASTDDYMETVITMTSGDRLVIACKYIESQRFD